ncbi:conserved hypothetical protein [Frankia canadensis]|uniref:SMI1/KNR4 family protein n=2 Tax=Frankia canadensis TaxID=1836972 RepID=A0A2I2KK61_9ACTN|nr:conserved hypothetical protein [Frankia canadensis]SOU53352.1 conserved hypothetical protein [Frankia canadensis]
MASLIPTAELPPGFSYPAEYLRVVAFGLTNLEPWILMDGDALRTAHHGLRDHFPGARLVPFATRRDNDEVACWDADAGDVVIVRRDAAAPCVADGRFEDFHCWLRDAVEHLTRFDG